MTRRTWLKILALLLAITALGLVWYELPKNRARRILNAWSRFLMGARGPAPETVDQMLERWTADVRKLGPKGVEICVEELERPPGWLEKFLTPGGSRANWLPRWQWLERRIWDGENRRMTAAMSLALTGPEAKEAVPILVRFARSIRTQNSRYFACAIAGLGGIGADSPEVIALLDDLKSSPLPDISVGAHVALWRIRPQDPGIFNAATQAFVQESSRAEFTINPFDWIRPRESLKPWVPVLRSAIPDPSANNLEAFARHMRAAHLVWRADGSTDLALAVLARLTNNAASLPAFPGGRDGWLFQLTTSLGDIPEFCRAVKPVLELTPATAGPEYRSNALLIVERTLRKSAAARAGPKEGSARPSR